MLATRHLASTFQTLVNRALRSQGVRSSANTARYLVDVLIRFVRPPANDLLDPPLGPSLLTALHLPRAQRVDGLRRVGDTALFLTGLFVERLERTLVGPDYYLTLGRTAYARLSLEHAGSMLAPSYAELAQRFPDFVRVLADIADRDLFASDDDVLRLYRRWLVSRSERDAAALIRRGVTPCPPVSTRRH